MDVQATGSTFLNLAIELQVQILQEVGLRDLTRCTRVCKVLRSVVAEETGLQYKMELERAGMVDGPAEVPWPVKLKKIRARNAAWDTGLSMHTGYTQSTGFVWPFAGGVFVYLETRENGDSVWRIQRPAWPELSTSGGLEYKAMLLAISGVPFMPSLRDVSPCAVNLEQDLVVFTKHRLEPDGAPVIYAFCQGGLRVVNWRTEAIVWRSQWQMAGRCLYLDSSHVVVVDHRGLFIYRFDPHVPPMMPPDWATEDTYLLHLAFPAFRIPVWDIISFECSEPGSRYFSSDRPFFREDAGSAVMAVSFFCRSLENLVLVLVIPIATINAALTAFSRSENPEEQEVRSAPWSCWGPDGARLLKLDRQPTTMISSMSAPTARRTVSMGAREMYLPPLGAPDDAAIDASDTISGLTSFAEPVTTRESLRLLLVTLAGLRNFEVDMIAQSRFLHEEGPSEDEREKRSLSSRSVIFSRYPSAPPTQNFCRSTEFLIGPYKAAGEFGTARIKAVGERHELLVMNDTSVAHHRFKQRVVHLTIGRPRAKGVRPIRLDARAKYLRLGLASVNNVHTVVALSSSTPAMADRLPSPEKKRTGGTLGSVRQGGVHRKAHRTDNVEYLLSDLQDSNSMSSFNLGGTLNDALGGSLNDAVVMVMQVLALMPLHTIVNHQYRYGSAMTQTTKTLYLDGGWTRYYQGLAAALVQALVSRFCDAVASVGILALLKGNRYTRDLPALAQAIFVSLTAPACRMVLTPIDTVKTAMHTDGKAGLSILHSR
ncbi:hypothetical protein OH76DRAFT_1424048, partial [Lentinus brumalis]